MTKGSIVEVVNHTKVAILEALLDSFPECSSEYDGPCIDVAKSGKGTVFYEE